MHADRLPPREVRGDIFIPQPQKRQGWAPLRVKVWPFFQCCLSGWLKISGVILSKRRAFDDGFPVGGKSAALVKEGADLPLELALGPVALETLVFAEGAFPRVFEPDQIRQMRP